ncbi:hypothetical protein LR48_Vigan08g098900 [Vigna angularis]|uniref:NAC domain-containing protein n=1 Tax=Phaseolus angularis TaxID=3914 RepID=A0A0L9V5E5_PHAAN|nr:hypothetical protein LR48_Vigan08g098900 [Vigna angularis]
MRLVNNEFICEIPLPGFRFHPTDEELVSFYLRRKLHKKPINIDLIKQIDIYKYDPWNLPKNNGSGGEKEGYFFYRRGRKYRNSIRPNRATGSGFWKATGIDKPGPSLARQQQKPTTAPPTKSLNLDTTSPQRNDQPMTNHSLRLLKPPRTVNEPRSRRPVTTMKDHHQ